MSKLTAEQVQRICDKVDRNFAKQVELLKAVVSVPSLRGAEAPAQHLLEHELRSRGYSVESFAIDETLVGKHPAFSPTTVSYDGTINVVGKRAGKDKLAKSIAFNAHIDIVPTGAREEWTNHPFEPSEVDGWLYGRGAGDMKAGLSANIFALDALKDAGFELRGDVQIQSVIEEEITGNGAAMMLALGHTADVLFVPEPTEETLVRANSGVLKFGITVYGIPSHPKNPELGKNAIELAVLVMAHLKKLEERWNAERLQKPLFAAIPNPVSLTIGTITGGEWIASTPAQCRLEGRVGFYPGEDPQARAAEFERHLAEAIQADPAFEGGRAPVLEWVGVMHAGYELAPGSEAEVLLTEARERIDGSKLEAAVMPCYLDAAIFAVHANIPALVYGPIAENIHGVDERVNLESLKRVTKTMAVFAAEWCGFDDTL
ncbi:ArgE/DapE family deacylase [Rhizobium sp. P38BS-XIX]|uniref:ArgE/DapE family deacylase n=1 Tax=Rhizobium sp. P38BS-XIX TaxID=2726740 RepID=UPI001457963B|nr:ArgE/DapE family deacylase [Rhizobium sp. P38BS-XIX]NLS01510.1 ArgE/DapE family deacylase [Rhizobium sp. P38BS-XIX]